MSRSNRDSHNRPESWTRDDMSLVNKLQVRNWLQLLPDRREDSPVNKCSRAKLALIEKVCDSISICESCLQPKRGSFLDKEGMRKMNSFFFLPSPPLFLSPAKMARSPLFLRRRRVFDHF